MELKDIELGCEPDSSGSRYGPVMGLCERDNKTFGFYKSLVIY
jgi:hypothetical protein